MIGLYDRDENLLHKTTLDEVPAIFQVATLYALLLLLLEGVFLQVGHLGPLAVARAVASALPDDGARPGNRAAASCANSSRSSAAWSWETRPRRRRSSGNSSSARSLKATVAGRVSLNLHDVNGAAPPVLGPFEGAGGTGFRAPDPSRGGRSGRHGPRGDPRRHPPGEGAGRQGQRPAASLRGRRVVGRPRRRRRAQPAGRSPVRPDQVVRGPEARHGPGRLDRSGWSCCRR